MSSTLPTFDSPDWFTGNSGGVLSVVTAEIAPGAAAVLGTSGGTSVIIFAESVASADPVQLQANFTSDLAGTLFLTTLLLSADHNDFFPPNLYCEVAAYGTAINILNKSATANVIVSVAASNRFVPNPRYLPSPSIATIAENASGFVAATAQQLVAFTGLVPGVPSNGKTAFTVQSSGAGQLDFRYTHIALPTPIIVPVMAVTGAAFQQTEVALPQCVGSLVFTPTGTDPAGSIVVQCYPVNP